MAPGGVKRRRGGGEDKAEEGETGESDRSRKTSAAVTADLPAPLRAGRK